MLDPYSWSIKPNSTRTCSKSDIFESIRQQDQQNLPSKFWRLTKDQTIFKMLRSVIFIMACVKWEPFSGKSSILRQPLRSLNIPLWASLRTTKEILQYEAGSIDMHRICNCSLIRSYYYCATKLHASELRTFQATSFTKNFHETVTQHLNSNLF